MERNSKGVGTRVLVWMFLVTGVALADGSSYRDIKGHWRGILKFHSGQEIIRFDIHDAPCQWGQPTETPYISQLEDGRTDVIATGFFPDGSPTLALFPLFRNSVRFILAVESFTEFRIEGTLIKTDGTATGTFQFIKQSGEGYFSHCYHKDTLRFDKDNGSQVVFDIYSLRFAKSEVSYCCDGRVFGQCTLSAKTCALSTMTPPPDYELQEHRGLKHGSNCGGKTVLASPPAPTAKEVGRFIFTDISMCRDQRYE